MTRQEKIDAALEKALEAKKAYKEAEKRLKQAWIDAENLVNVTIDEAEDD
jgi:hypothetical protein